MTRFTDSPYERMMTRRPEGVYCYDLRGSDYDPGEPVCVEAVSYTHSLGCT